MTNFWTLGDYDRGFRDNTKTHIDGPPLCQCGKPCKSYLPRCEDCWLEATKGTRTDSLDRRAACIRFGEEARER